MNTYTDISIYKQVHTLFFGKDNRKVLAGNEQTQMAQSAAKSCIIDICPARRR